MRVNYLLAFLFLAFISVIVIASVDEINLIGCTELNGQGCVCHTVERDYSVNVWVEGPESLMLGKPEFIKCLWLAALQKAADTMLPEDLAKWFW